MSWNYTQRLALGWVLLIALVLLLLWTLGPVLQPFVAALVLAYALHPVVDRLVVRRWPRPLAAVLVIVLFMLAAAALVLLVVPVIAKELPVLRQQLPQLIEEAHQRLAPVVQSLGMEWPASASHWREAIMQWLAENNESLRGAAIASAKVGGGILLSVLGQLMLVPLLMFYFLLDWPRMVRAGRRMVPPRLRTPVVRFLRDCDEILGQYLRGQVLVMLTLAAYYAIALRATGLELGVPVGIFTGLAVFIPYLGFGLGLVLALLAAVLQHLGDAQWLWGVVGVGAVYGVGQLLESFWLTPRMVGERIGLHPMAVIFALMAFGHLLGFVGVLVALPLSALSVVAARRLLKWYLSSAVYRGRVAAGQTEQA